MRTMRRFILPAFLFSILFSVVIPAVLRAQDDCEKLRKAVAQARQDLEKAEADAKATAKPASNEALLIIDEPVSDAVLKAEIKYQKAREELKPCLEKKSGKAAPGAPTRPPCEFEKHEMEAAK